MSIIGRRSREGPAPEWQYEFKTAEEWTAHIGEKFFAGLLPNEPILLVIRQMDHDSSGRTLPSSWMETHYYIGHLADTQPLFSFKECLNEISNNAGFVLGMREFLSFPETFRNGEMRSYVRGSLEVQYSTFHYTPVTKPFEPPFESSRSHDLFKKEVEAFAVACGVTAMEALAAQESLWNRNFLGWYARAIAQLRIPAESEEIATKQEEEKVALIQRLQKHHRDVLATEEHIRKVHGSVGVPQMQNGALSIITDEVLARLITSDSRGNIKDWIYTIKHTLAVARRMGMLEEQGLVMVDGFRCQPAIVIEDFCRLYAVEL